MSPRLGDLKGYRMQLGNDQKWHIQATEGVKSWLEKLADIMELKRWEQNGLPRLILTCREPGEESCREPISLLNSETTVALPPNGWKCQNLVWLQLWSHRAVPDIICEMGPQKGKEQDILRMRLSLQPIYQRTQDSGGFPFHAALVERDGKGVLLAAPRNTGKSTCCRRLPAPWHTLCDEESLIVRNVQQQYLAHPFPTWSDYLTGRSERTWNTQHHLPLSAIFFLEQADADEVIPVGEGEAAASMCQSAMQVCYRYWSDLDRKGSRTLKKGLFKNACELARVIPAFKLRVSLEGRFWEKIESVLP